MSERRTYTPRPISPEREALLAEHVNRLVENNYYYIPHDLARESTVQDLSDCPHTTGTFIEVENDHGVWGMVICNNCGRFQDGPQCAHVSCSWNEAGTLLTCDNCGIDAT